MIKRAGFTSAGLLLVMLSANAQDGPKYKPPEEGVPVLTGFVGLGTDFQPEQQKVLPIISPIVLVPFQSNFGTPGVRREWFEQLLKLAFVSTIICSYSDFGAIGSAALLVVEARPHYRNCLNWEIALPWIFP